MKPQRNRRGHRETLIYNKLYKAFQSAQCIPLCPPLGSAYFWLWFAFSVSSVVKFFKAGELS